ncbi:MAG: 16S rRNA (cytosine(1402)-N(4))-methyltransferase RsmH [Candidatus Pacebacteria bacterium]|nr:16S rRNA (cytosine(1402)-N(4))-methyltransferase RsmH [Candidatus Paceibacterota bacterium]
MAIHIPVMLNETVDAIAPREGDCVIDGTFGAGGHSALVLERVGATGKLLAIDWNEHAVRGCAERYAEDRRVTCAVGNFAEMADIARLSLFPKANGVILDLGISSDELNHSGRGFTFQEDEPLLMTYSDNQESIADILKQVSEDDLAAIIKTYGEERYAARIARAIKEKMPVETTKQLADIITNAVPNQGKKYRIHPATRTFMALRIYANKELENVEQAITVLPQVVAPGGRVAILSFHSLEDRIVKHRFRDMAKEGKITIVTKKPLIPSEEEVKNNPRARSAKLRICIIN